jgi:hypothetical protein
MPSANPIRVTAVVLSIVFHAVSGQAARLDCSTAATRVEQEICANPTLQDEDEAMIRAYAEALAASLDRQTLRNSQDKWANGRDFVDPRSLVALYRSRTAYLVEEARRWKDFGHDFPEEAIETSCVALPDTPRGALCDVDKAGPVPGDGTLVYQLQSYPDAYRGLVIVFRSEPADPDMLTPIAVANAHYESLAVYDAPRVFSSPQGKLLLIPGGYQGTAHFNASSLYRYDPSSLREVDLTAWEGQVSARLPQGLEIWKGIYPDYATMTAITSLWRPTDSNCCPTGGLAKIRLGFDDDKLVVREVAVEPLP